MNKNFVIMEPFCQLVKGITISRKVKDEELITYTCFLYF